jgi:hypothetical protein
MLRNKLIRYKANESGVYLFVPTVPLSFLGLRIRHISGFDYDGFDAVPSSRMVGTAPPVFLEIDVAASTADLSTRARTAGLVLKRTSPHKAGLIISTRGLASYLADETHSVTSSIACVL